MVWLAPGSEVSRAGRFVSPLIAFILLAKSFYVSQPDYIADLHAIISDAPQSFTFDGEEFTGTISGLSMRKPLEVGGFDDQPEMTLVIAIRRLDGSFTMPRLPVVGDLLTVGTVEYSVDRTEIDQFNAGFQMDLRSKER